MANYTKVIAVLVLTTHVYIFHIHGMAQHCINGSDIVPPCSNVNIPTNQMFIPINGSIGQGCLCDVTVVHAPDHSTLYFIFIKHAQTNTNCGYQVDVLYETTTSSITCLEFGSFSNTLRQGEFQRLRFIRESTPNPPTTAGFCLQVISQNKDVQFNLHCWDINGRRPATTTAVEIDPSLSSSVTHRTSSSATTVSKQTTLPASTPPTPTEEEIDPSLSSSVTHRKSSPATTVLKQTTLPPATSQNTISTLQLSAVTQRHTQATQTWTPTTAESGVQTTINGVTNKSSVMKIQVAAIGGGIGGGLLLLIVIIVIICLCKRRRKNNYGQPFDRITESTNYNNLRVKDEMIVMDNDLYVSYDDDKNQSITSPTSDIQHAHRFVTASVHNNVKKSNAEPGCGITDAHQSVMTADHSKSTSSPDDMIILENDLYASADSSAFSAADIDDNTSDENSPSNRTRM